MKLVPMFLGIAGSVFALALLVGCGVETNQARALQAKHNAAIRRLLVSLEIYKGQKGTLPKSLEELRKDDVQIRDIAISEYTYNPNGIVAADDSIWLLAIPNPLQTNQLIVGRLPVEVATRLPREN